MGVLHLARGNRKHGNELQWIRRLILLRDYYRTARHHGSGTLLVNKQVPSQGIYHHGAGTQGLFFPVGAAFFQRFNQEGLYVGHPERAVRLDSICLTRSVQFHQEALRGMVTFRHELQAASVRHPLLVCLLLVFQRQLRVHPGRR